MFGDDDGVWGCLAVAPARMGAGTLPGTRLPQTLTAARYEQTLSFS